jgi:ADP-heptose:LPS heptosyltransferase
MKLVSPASRLKTVGLRMIGYMTHVQAGLASVIHSRSRADGGNGRILVVRLDETIGDNVMFSAFMRELRSARPDAEVTLVINEQRRDLFEHCPYADKLVVSPFGSGATPRLLARPILEWTWCRKHLRGTFEVALVPRTDYDHHALFIAACARAATVVGYRSDVTQRKKIVARGTDSIVDEQVEWRPHEHETDRSLALLRHFGFDPHSRATEMWIGPMAVDQADRVLAVLGGQSFVALAPSGGHSVLKPWPPNFYGDIAAAARREGLAVVVIGATHDRPLVDRFDGVNREELLDLTGRLSVMSTAEVIRRAQWFVGSDSGMSHVAAAVGTRAMVLFGPGCPHTFGPRGPRASAITLDLPCNPCHRETVVDQCITCIYPEPICMTLLKPDQVLEQRNVIESIVKVGSAAR